MQLLTATQPDGMLSCTVIAYNYPAEFSVITGTLTSLGLSVEAGDVFTYKPTKQPSTRRRRVRRTARFRLPLSCH